MSERHESLYRQTIHGFAENVRRGCYTPSSLPLLIDQLREELSQCVELFLISADVHEELLSQLAIIFDEHIPTAENGTPVYPVRFPAWQPQASMTRYAT